MIKFLILAILVLFFLVALVRYIESKSIFLPSKEIPVTPEDISLAYEDVYFTTPDHLKLNGWLIKNPRAQATLIFFHGNAGNISQRLEKIAMFYSMGLKVFIIDYRGYGRSQGQPTEEGIYKDAMAAYDYLLARADIRKDKIIGYGASLGGVVAVDLATKRKLAALIVDSSFPSAAAVSQIIYPFLPTVFLKTNMDSIGKVKTITTAKLFIHSINDEIIPFALGKELFDAAATPKEFLQITGGHNSNHVDSRDKFLSGVGSFLLELNLI